MKYCTCCGTELTNSIDTFGDVGQEFCWDCWSSLEFDVPTFEAVMSTAQFEAVPLEEGQANS